MLTKIADIVPLTANLNSKPIHNYILKTLGSTKLTLPQHQKSHVPR